MSGPAAALPTMKQLRHLAALAEHRHFGRAAEACHVTQSTLSASIGELEAILEASLVDRTKRRVAFTPMGDEIAARARAVLREAEELAQAAQAGKRPLSGTVRLGVIPTIAPFLLPRALPRLRRAYPELRLYLTEDLTQRLVEGLHAGTLDVLLLALPYDSGTVDGRDLFEDRFVLACRKDSPSAGRAVARPRDLAGETLLLLRDGHCLREHALAACRLTERGHVDPFEATSLHTLVQMVDNGIGVTLLPQLAIDAGILKGTSLVTVPLGADSPVRRIGLIWRRGTARRGEFELLAEALAPQEKRTGA